jgi:hypothetical protein
MWCSRITGFLLGAAALVAAAPRARAQTPRLVRERAYDLGNTGRTAFVQDVQWLPDGRLLAAGPTQLVGTGWQTHVFVLDGNTLDTLWVRPGAVGATGGERVHAEPRGQLRYWGNALGPGLTPEWGGQRFTPAGTSAGPHLVPNPLGVERVFSSSLPTGNGDYFLVGTGLNTPRVRGELVRVDSLGNPRWARYYGWGLNDYLWELAYTDTGTLLLAGVAQPSGSPNFGLKLVEVTAQGDSVRGALLAPLGPGVNTTFRSTYNRILPLAGGDFLLACDADTVLNNRRVSQPVLVRLTRQLQVRWARRYPPQPLADRHATATAALADGSLLLLAYQALPQPTTSFELLRVDGSTGRLLNRYVLPSQLAQQRLTPVCLVPDPAGGGRWLVAGSCERGYYLAHLDLSGLPAGVTAAPTPQPLPRALQLSPNPAAERVTVRRPVGQPAATLRLVDALGRLVRTQPMGAGQTSAEVDVRSFSPGLYACQLLVAGRLVDVQRLYVVH